MKRILALAAALLICLFPLGARADDVGMLTVRLGELVVSDGKTSEEVRMALQLEMGADPDAMRALVRLTLSPGSGLPIVAAASLENGEIRAHLTGMDTGFVIPLEQLTGVFKEEFELYGKTWDELPPELIAAFENYVYTLLDTFAAGPQLSLFSLPTPEQWRDRQQTFLTLYGAEKTGEEEILLFGESVKADRYAYRLERVAQEEYEAMLLPSLTPVDALAPQPVQEALDRLENELSKLREDFFTQLYPSEDGLLTTEETAVYYSERGEVALSGETGTQMTAEMTAHYPWGDEVTSMTLSERYTGDSLRHESGARTSSDGETAVTDVSIVMEQGGEDGTSLQHFVQYAITDDETGRISYSDRQETGFSLKGNKLSLSLSGSSFYGEYSTTTKGGMDLDIHKNSLSGVARLHESDSEGYISEASIQIACETGALPAGELVILPENTVNPLTADEETMEALSEEAFSLIVRVAGAFLVPGETPGAAGGALIR